MNSIFKELYDSGRIDNTPIFDYTHEGKKINVYQFSNDGAGMSQSRFEMLGEVMRAYNAFETDPEDSDIYMDIVENNITRAMVDYRGDAESAFKLMNEVIMRTKEMKARKEFGVPLGRSWDFASFIAIEEDENPLLYDEKYNKEKIKRWKASLEVEKKIPYLRLMLPLFPTTSRLFEPDSLKYLQQQVLQSALALRRIIDGLGSDGASNEMRTSLELQMEKLKNESTYLTELSRIITGTQSNIG
jgi:hypothetical protein